MAQDAGSEGSGAVYVRVTEPQWERDGQCAPGELTTFGATVTVVIRRVDQAQYLAALARVDTIATAAFAFNFFADPLPLVSVSAVDLYDPTAAYLEGLTVQSLQLEW